MARKELDSARMFRASSQFRNKFKNQLRAATADELAAHAVAGVIMSFPEFDRHVRAAQKNPQRESRHTAADNSKLAHAGEYSTEGLLRRFETAICLMIGK